MVAVCVPWRPGNGHRNANWQYVQEFWKDYPVVTGDTDGPFNRAAARNAAAARTTADVLVFADADTIGEHDAIRQAIDHAEQTGELTYPHTRTVRLTHSSTDAFKAGLPYKTALATITGSPCGIVVVRRDLYEQVRWDEGFTGGWGYEDVSFAIAAATLGGVHRVEGSIFHLWHPIASEKTKAIRYQTPNRARRNRYGAAEGNPEAMRRLLKELRCG